MVESEGTFLRQHQRKGFAARVRIVLHDTPVASTVLVKLDNTSPPPSFSQGDIEIAYASAYNDWIQGAVIGAFHALADLKNATYAVTITEIVGLATDTNPTIVAVASIWALWNAVGYQPSDEKIRLLETQALASWDLPFDALPTF